MILALDLATHTGWAVASNDGKIISSGVQDFSKKRGEDNGLLFLRFLRGGYLRFGFGGILLWFRLNFTCRGGRFVGSLRVGFFFDGLFLRLKYGQV